MTASQMLVAHEQVGFTGALATRSFIMAGPDSPMADEYSRMGAAFVIGGDPGPSGQGYIDPSVGNAVSRYVKDVWARPGESLTGRSFSRIPPVPEWSWPTGVGGKGS